MFGSPMQTGVLDDKTAIGRIDQENMLQVLEETPETYEQAYADALKSETLPHARVRHPRHLALVGMGGSAIAADILKDWLFESPIMIEVVRSSKLPGSVAPASCVLIASYSGRTAEALKALREARRRRSRISCIASEGEMIRICRQDGIPHVQVKAGLQPREALPHLLSASLVTLARWGICNRKAVRSELKTITEQVVELRRTIRFAQPEANNPAKQLAVQLHGTMPFVYSCLLLAAAGRRFKNQLNENSKVLAKFEVLPEMLHNEVQSWRMLKEADFADRISFVLLRGCESEDESRQFNRLTKLIRQDGSKRVYEISLNSPRRLATILAIIYYCDYVSFYLAILRGLDPTPIETIWTLKYSSQSSTA